MAAETVTAEPTETGESASATPGTAGALSCSFCERRPVAMHAIPSFQHPTRVVLVCASHKAAGERSPLAGIGDQPASRTATVKLARAERIARLLTVSGLFFMGLAAAIALVYIVGHLL